jgi:hypothetical protein
MERDDHAQTTRATCHQGEKKAPTASDPHLAQKKRRRASPPLQQANTATKGETTSRSPSEVPGPVQSPEKPPVSIKPPVQRQGEQRN